MRTDDFKHWSNEFLFKVGKFYGYKQLSYWTDICEKAENKPTIFLFDEFGALTDREVVKNIIEKIFYLVNTSSKIRIIVALPKPIKEFLQVFIDNDKYWTIWYTIIIEPFNREQVVSMLSLLPNPIAEFTTLNLDIIMTITKGYPKPLQRICYRLFEKRTGNYSITLLEDFINNKENYL